jgi:RNA polymerase sigma-70 factor, ECF subfamily
MSEQPESPQDQTAPSEQFATQLTAAQGVLYAYVCSLLGGSRDASDVLQDTNLVLWRKAAEFKPELSFNAWAYKIAFFQVLAYRKRHATDRHVSNFSDDSLGRIAARMETVASSFARRVRLLDDCIARLPDYQRELIQLRYAERLGVGTIARTLQKSENSIAAVLYRARRSLIDCVETKPEAGDLP